MNELTTIDNNDGFLIINTLEQALKVSEIICKSSFCPKDYKDKPGDVLVCMQFGKEVGLKPMQALQNIAVINGRPCIWGDAMLALCLNSPHYEYVEETFDESTMTAYCKAKRKGDSEKIGKFSLEQAKKANLTGKGAWIGYQNRMLQMRARGFALRDAFADVLKGLISAEEAGDYQTAERVQTKKPEFQNMIASKQHQPVREVHAVGTLPGDAFAVISPDDLGILNDKVDAANADVIAICNHFKIESLDFVPKESVQKLFQQLDRKIEKLANKNVLHGTMEAEVASFFENAE